MDVQLSPEARKLIATPLLAEKMAGVFVEETEDWQDEGVRNICGTDHEVAARRCRAVGVYLYDVELFRSYRALDFVEILQVRRRIAGSDKWQHLSYHVPKRPGTVRVESERGEIFIYDTQTRSLHHVPYQRASAA